MLQPFQMSPEAAASGFAGLAAKYGSLPSRASQRVAADAYDGRPGAVSLTTGDVVTHVTKSAAAGRVFECLEMIHGPPPICPVVMGASLFQRSGIAAVMCPAGIFSVPSNTSFAYQAGPGIIRTFESAPPYFWAKVGVKMFSGGVVPFLISG